MRTFLPIQKITERLYRSPQPEFEDFLKLRSKGINTVVNLRDEAPESGFFAKQAKIGYLHLAVIDWELPTLEQVYQFISLVDDDEAAPVLVHCAAGVGRTGTFVACYRISQGMDPEEAVSLTNSETPLPGVTMNQKQMDFVRAFGSI